MLEFVSGAARNCEGMTRREAIKVGALSFAGLTLPGVLQAQAAAGAAAGGKKDINCILIWLDGGPSHIDMFDPKPEAPAEIRGEFGAIKTKVPGIVISDQLPKLAEQMDKYSIIKGTTPDASHGTGNHYFLTGYKFNPTFTYPSFGALYAREKGYRNSMPPYAIIGGMAQYTGGGYMGAGYDPFNVGGDPNSANFSVKDVSLPANFKSERFSRRRAMLDSVDRFQRNAELAHHTVREMDQFYQKGFDLITSPVAKKAFNLNEEPKELRDKYGRTSFGQGCLLARRLVEAGVRFITLNKPGWDTHTVNFETLKKHRLPELDQGYAALLADLHDRGLLENTMVICMGEFGRTPRVNSSAGRDHWSGSMFVTIGGGGVKTGLIAGDSDVRGEVPVDRVITVEDVAATIYTALGIPLEREYQSTIGRPFYVNQGGTPIRELL